MVQQAPEKFRSSPNFARLLRCRVHYARIVVPDSFSELVQYMTYKNPHDSS